MYARNCVYQEGESLYCFNWSLLAIELLGGEREGKRDPLLKKKGGLGVGNLINKEPSTLG
ncbi:hypothetical protein LguiA_025707 [Lonicera macranthoides]